MKNVIQSAFLLVFSFVICIFIAEFSLIVAIEKLPPSVLLYAHKSIKHKYPKLNEVIIELNPWASGREVHPDYGWTFKKNSISKKRKENEDGEKIIRRRTSSEGFYTPDVPDEKKYQLVLLGDSFLSTYYTNVPIAWRIKGELNIPVYNLSVGGWGPESYRRAFNKLACNRNMAEVVPVFSFINDVTDVNNWSLWEQSGKYLSFIDWIWEENPRDEPINNSDTWLDKNSILWNWIKYAIYFNSQKILSKDKDKNNNAMFKLVTLSNKKSESFTLQLNLGHGFIHFEPEDYFEGGRYWKYMQAYYDSLDKLSARIDACGSKMALVWIPAKERVYIPVLEKKLYDELVVNKSKKIDGYEKSIKKYTSSRNIPFLDLTPQLIKRAASGEKLYFKVDGHLNSHGNNVVGKIAADFIKKYLKK